MDFSSLDFAAPHWLILTLILPFLVVLKVWSRQRATRDVTNFVSRRLQGNLVNRHGVKTDWWIYSLQLLGLLALVVTLARPQWGYREIESLTEGRNVIIGIDTSRSMLAEDLKPNRLTRAKLAAEDLVRSLPYDRIGVIAFAGKAFTLAPLTVDHSAVLETIQQTDTEIIPRGGSNMVPAVELALETMAQSESRLAALVLFSDGEDHEGEGSYPDLLSKVRTSKLMIITIGVGSEGGAIIPDPNADQPGVFIKDNEGNIVRSRLETTRMRDLADISDGVHLDMTDNSSVSDVVRQALRKIDTQTMLAGNRREAIDRYPLPLVVAILCFVLSYAWPMLVPLKMKKPSSSVALKKAAAVLLVAGVSILMTERLQAADDPLTSYQEGDYDTAEKQYREALEEAKREQIRAQLSFGQGAAAYQKGDFETAMEAFGQSLALGDRQLQELSHYNLGNTLYQAGRVEIEDPEATKEQWGSAIDHYKAALELNRNNGRASRNLEFVEQMLELLENPPPDENNDNNQDQDEQQDQQDQNQQQQQNQGQQDQQEDQNDQSNQDPKQNPENEEQEPPKPDDPEDQEKDGDKEQEPPKPDEQDPQNGQPPQGQPQPPQPREWTPSEARQILENNSDEHKDLQAIEMETAVGYFKNW